ncbi:MAG: hypothetical protein E7324_06920 [Clostridiales bacterium]|nr:hypothetical protein [Clostridiales bacterium]
MSRTTYIVNCRDAAAANAVAEKILREEKFDYISEKGENVWKCGNGTWAAIKYIKLSIVDPNTLHITGWVKSDVGGEMNLDGIFGGMPKKQTVKVIKRIQASIL